MGIPLRRPTGAVTGTHILDATVDTADLATDAVTTVKITDANVTTAKIADDAITEVKVADSDGTGALGVMKIGIAVYDFAVDGGGAPGAIVLADSATFPDNAIVELVNYNVLTTCQSAGDTGTIKVGFATDGDLSTAIAIDDASNPWDAGGHVATTVTPLVVKLTAARGITLTTATQALTAGKIVFCFRYWVGQ